MKHYIVGRWQIRRMRHRERLGYCLAPGAPSPTAKGKFNEKFDRAATLRNGLRDGAGGRSFSQGNKLVSLLLRLKLFQSALAVGPLILTSLGVSTCAALTNCEVSLKASDSLMVRFLLG
jgi:hypothetical protein